MAKTITGSVFEAAHVRGIGLRTWPVGSDTLECVKFLNAPKVSWLLNGTIISRESAIRLLFWDLVRAGF